MVNNKGKWRNIDRKNVREVQNSMIVQIGQLQELFGGSAPTLVSDDMPNAIGIGSDGKLFVNVAAAGGISDVRLNGASIVSGGIGNITGVALSTDLTSAISTEVLNRNQAISDAVAPINTTIADIQTDLTAAALEASTAASDITAVQSDITSIQSSISTINSSITTLQSGLAAVNPAPYDLSTLSINTTAAQVAVAIDNVKGTSISASIPPVTATAAGVLSAAQYSTISGYGTRIAALEAGGGGGGGGGTMPGIATDTTAGIVLSDPTTPGNVSVDLTGIMTVNDAALQSDISTLSGAVTTVSGQISSVDIRVGTAETNITTLQGGVSTNTTDIAALTGRVDTAETDITDIQTDIINLQSTDTGLQQQIDDLNAVSAAGEIAIHNADTTAHAALNIPRQASDIGAATPLYVDNGIGTHNTAVGAHANLLDPITDLIPSAATSTNQLADKDFVNSSIENMASNYITPTAAGDEQFASLADLQAGPWYFRGQPKTPTNNDFAMVLTGSPVEQWRAAFDGAQWNLLYKINDSPFTSAQLAAMDSGINAALVQQIQDNATDISNTADDISTLNSKKASAVGDPNGAIPAVNAMALNGKADTAFAAASHTHNASNVMSAGVLPVTYGGTGLSSQAAGNMRYATNTTTSTMISPPAANVRQLLVHTGSVATAPAWTDDTTIRSDVTAMQTIKSDLNLSNHVLYGVTELHNSTASGPTSLGIASDNGNVSIDALHGSIIMTSGNPIEMHVPSNTFVPPMNAYINSVPNAFINERRVSTGIYRYEIESAGYDMNRHIITWSGNPCIYMNVMPNTDTQEQPEYAYWLIQAFPCMFTITLDAAVETPYGDDHVILTINGSTYYNSGGGMLTQSVGTLMHYDSAGASIPNCAVPIQLNMSDSNNNLLVMSTKEDWIGYNLTLSNMVTGSVTVMI